MTTAWYGDPIVGGWYCCVELFPIPMRTMKLEWNGEAWLCPTCRSPMVYDEAA